MPPDVIEISRAGGSTGGSAGETVGESAGESAGGSAGESARAPRRPRRSLPLFISRVQAGFPSPADDYLEGALDLNEHLIKRPAATFFLRVTGDSMTGAGIHSGDLLIVDKSITPADGMIVIAVVDGELTVKRLYFRHGKIRLMAENPAYRPIPIGCGQDLHV